MTSEDENCLRDTIVELQKQILELRASETAFRKILKNLADKVPQDLAATLTEYEQLYQDAYQEQMIKIENSNPAFAAELDRDRPPLH